ncbi:hypothetical protein SARC_13713 [Sphaeroforma arctica JP610]|uniref:Uncharacterized protein n=1 Tax=Sphaeroforma arctica JP610 TaxID=667725 RepID=A0A0L0FAF9_9EUKA|nr:hypothetical protein SARC_13713 [Sphaeroforma arctica JP610]KNC73730.1 hypothetical protein SARC_13713 [Sphaeroforma arctica JP610]|eukprot:XP_014147632.1 hypothetical protein SARC_13713 [Sphaeroforma arctica JP610]
MATVSRNVLLHATGTESDFLLYAHFIQAILALIKNYGGGNKWMSKHAQQFFERLADTHALQLDYHDMSVHEREGQNNAEVLVFVRITDCLFRLPHTLYTCPTPLYALHVSEAVIDVRNASDFMEIMFSFDPITLLPTNKKGR